MLRRAIPLEQQKADFTAEGSPPPGTVAGAAPAVTDDKRHTPAPPPRPPRRPTLHRPRRTKP